MTYGADLVANGDFAAAAGWAPGDGWAVAAGAAACDGSQAAASSLAQTLAALVEGCSYRVTFTASGLGAGTLTPRLGGTLGTPVAADGAVSEVLVCGGGRSLELVASADFVGAVDDVTLCQEFPAASQRRLLRDQVLAKVASLALGGATVALWKGEPQAFNAAPTFPLVSVSYGGGRPGPLAKRGAAFWDRDVDLVVLVETSDDTAADGDGEGHALDLLEVVEQGLQGFRPAAKIELAATGEEELVGSELGTYLYGQLYRAKTLIQSA